MRRFVEGVDRGQTTLLPECLGDWVEESNPVRAVDVFVEALDLADLGFDGVQPLATGRRFVSLGDTWCDTTNEMGRFMLTVMSGIAELERDLIRKRCQAGIERAKAKGTKFGRSSVLDASQRRKIAERYARGETMGKLAREYDCGEATIWRALRGRWGRDH